MSAECSFLIFNVVRALKVFLEIFEGNWICFELDAESFLVMSALLKTKKPILSEVLDFVLQPKVERSIALADEELRSGTYRE